MATDPKDFYLGHFSGSYTPQYVYYLCTRGVLTHLEAMVAGLVTGAAQTTGVCTYKTKTIATLLGANPGSVRRACCKLVEIGMVERYQNDPQQPSTMVPLWDGTTPLIEIEKQVAKWATKGEEYAVCDQLGGVRWRAGGRALARGGACASAHHKRESNIVSKKGARAPAVHAPAKGFGVAAPSSGATKLATLLYQAVHQYKPSATRTAKRGNWPAQIEELPRRYSTTKRVVAQAIKWYTQNIGQPYVPNIYSPTGLRSKWYALQKAMARQGVAVAATAKPTQYRPGPALDFATTVAALGWGKHTDGAKAAAYADRLALSAWLRACQHVADTGTDAKGNPVPPAVQTVVQACNGIDFTHALLQHYTQLHPVLPTMRAWQGDWAVWQAAPGSKAHRAVVDAAYQAYTCFSTPAPETYYDTMAGLVAAASNKGGL